MPQLKVCSSEVLACTSNDPCTAPSNYLDKHKGIKDSGRRGMAGMMSALDDQITAVRMFVSCVTDVCSPIVGDR